ncbi:hypothetical protein AYO21_10472 [Fonsecaea monophora]|uniref:VOC domain-containing protein n=1 Tax=Fonsecaea monophora TaxID=254056 RepID=A0A177EWA9_9EURO|nr:hypothetical protein AYO21_10472 [Fonsecaea monophora]OAG35332.1 hypothetical protein AYO21_10472 [Fonsecaea monophora]
MTYKVLHMWHPSHKVLDLAAAERFFKDVFGRDSEPVERHIPPKEQAPEYPRDYAVLTPIQEVLFDSIDPKKYVVEGRKPYDDVTKPHLHGLGWVVEGAEEIYQTCLKHVIRSTDQVNRLGSPDKPPVVGFSKSPCFFTLPEVTGLRYQIYPVSATEGADPRAEPGWSVPPLSESDPLSLEFCSHHTVLTCNPEQGKRFLVDILRGRIIHQGRNEILETDSTYIALGDGVYELAVPTRDGSFAAEELKHHDVAPFDSYISLTFKVKDLAKVEKHLAAMKIRTLVRDQHTITTDPEDTIGVAWGFTDKLVPGDPRT